MVLKSRTPYERAPGPMTMTYDLGEKWGVSSTAALTDATAAYPDVVMKWLWMDKPEGSLMFLATQQVTKGAQAVPSQVDLRITSPQGKEVAITKKRRDWRTLDEKTGEVSVLVFVEVSPVPEELDAGANLTLIDLTPFTGDRTTFWYVNVRSEKVELQTLDARSVAVAMQNLVEMEQTDFEIGLPASRVNSISSSLGYPDLATLHHLLD